MCQLKTTDNRPTGSALLQRIPLFSGKFDDVVNELRTEVASWSRWITLLVTEETSQRHLWQQSPEMDLLSIIQCTGSIVL